MEKGVREQQPKKPVPSQNERSEMEIPLQIHEESWREFAERQIGHALDGMIPPDLRIELLQSTIRFLADELDRKQRAEDRQWRRLMAKPEASAEAS